jgi:hypothetical protein
VDEELVPDPAQHVGAARVEVQSRYSCRITPIRPEPVSRPRMKPGILVEPTL